MMRRWQKMMLMALGTLIAATAVSAYPNLNATTGLVGLPTATEVAPGTLVLAADGLFFDRTLVDGRVVYGVTDRIEVGGGVVVGNHTGILANAKYRLPFTPFGFTTAVGAAFASETDSRDGTQLYFVGTIPLASIAPSGTRIMGTLGVDYTNFDGDSGLRPFAGAQLFLGSRSELGAEYGVGTGSLGKPVSSIYWRQLLTPQWSGQVGFTNIDRFVGRDTHDVFVGLSYLYSTGK
ncbi:MAG TPA: hypothetical protein VGL77_04085 [Armatimonadota bacterium]